MEDKPELNHNDIELSDLKSTKTATSQAALVPSTQTESQHSPFARLMQWCCLLANILGGSLIGPVSNILPTKGRGVYLNLAWRF